MRAPGKAWTPRVQNRRNHCNLFQIIFNTQENLRRSRLAVNQKKMPSAGEATEAAQPPPAKRERPVSKTEERLQVILIYFQNKPPFASRGKSQKGAEHKRGYRGGAAAPSEAWTHRVPSPPHPMKKIKKSRKNI